MDENTAAVALLLAAAAQMAEAPAASEPPTGNIDDLHRLWKEKAEVEQKLAEIDQKLQVMQNQLKGISEEKADLVRRQRAIQAQAAKLCDVLFGIGIETRQEQPQPTSTPPAGSAAPTRKIDNSVVIDRSVPGTALPYDAPQEAAHVQALGGFNF